MYEVFKNHTKVLKIKYFEARRKVCFSKKRVEFEIGTSVKRFYCGIKFLNLTLEEFYFEVFYLSNLLFGT